MLKLSSAASFGKLAPTISAQVAIRSTWQIVSSHRLSASTTFGHRAMKGTRCPPSHTSAFVPRSGALLFRR